MDYHKDFVKLISSIEHTRRVSDVMDDFLEMAVVAIANRFYNSKTLESSYLGVVKKYTSNQAAKFSELLGIVAAALSDEPKQDFLGRIYEEIGEPNQDLGQFFTPYVISQITAESVLGNGEVEKAIASKGYVTVADPACGAGCLMIAFRNSMSDRGYGSDSMFATVVDIDKNCLNMAYIQLSFLGVAAELLLGNFLTRKFKMRLCTPTTFLVPRFWHLPYCRPLVEIADESVPMPSDLPVSHLEIDDSAIAVTSAAESVKPAKSRKKSKAKVDPVPVIVPDVQLSLFSDQRSHG